MKNYSEKVIDCWLGRAVGGTLIFVFMLSGLGLAAGESDASLFEMLSAYGELNYSRAIGLARDNQDIPEGRLVKALCLLHSVERQDLPGAFSLLRGLCEDESCPLPVRIQAMMAYARTAQLVRQRQEVFGSVADDIDYRNIFERIVKLVPESREACLAMVFGYYDDFNSGNKALQDLAMKRLENFCAGFDGDKKHLVPVHLYAESRYIMLREDYASALRHLIAAYDAGIANPKERPIILYRIARICDIKLKDREKALKYYREFLEKYPESAYISIVRRFVKEMQEGAGANGKD